MSAILTWFNSGLETKSGTTAADLFGDIVSAFNANSADSDFSWEVASSNTATTPYTIVLKPKDAGVGRILLCAFTSAESNYNSAIFNGSTSTNRFYFTYFPAGSTDAVSNLNAASGTMMGDDTGALYVSPPLTISTIYGSSVQFYYFDSAEAVVFGFQNPTATSCYGGAVGNILVDAQDNVYPANMGLGGGSWASWGSTSGILNWATGERYPNSSTARVRANYGGDNKLYFHAFNPSGNWANAVSGSSLMIDTGSSNAFFVPVQLVGQERGEGLVLKWRQICHGPPTTGAFATIETTGPVVQARQLNAYTSGQNGAPWVTNFKI